MSKKRVIVPGETVETAVRQGLKQIGLSKEMVAIKVLQIDRNTFFGGHQDAVVSIIFDENESIKAIREARESEFRQTFLYRFEDTTAQIKVPPMFFDNEYFEDDVQREEFLYDFLKTKGIETPDKDAIKQLSTDPQAQTAFVSIKTFEAESLNERGDKIHYLMSVDNMECQSIVFHISDEGPSEDDIYASLEKQKYIKGILRKNIEEVVRKRYTGYFNIARGLRPVDDAPAPVEVFFAEDEQKEFSEMMEALTIDTRTVKDINLADRNQLLMRIGEITPGHDGYTIPGTILRKKEIAPSAAVNCGPNVYYSDDESEIYAEKAGHIVWRAEDNYIDIEPVYIVEGNVDFNEGNIVGFVGKVVVRGDVKPKFSVVAEGDIEIHGTVEDAIVESTNGNIFVGGTIIHKNEGYIQAKSSVHGMIASNAKIRAKHIVMQKEIMNSELEAYEDIIITGTPGVFVGGVARAKTLIRANIIGSESWVPTKIHVGDVTDMKKRLRTLNQHVGKQTTELKETKQIAKMLQDRQQSHELTEAQQEQLDAALERATRLEEDIEYDHEEEAELREEIESLSGAKLEVIKTLYPHVDLNIYEGYYLPPTEENRTGFLCKEGLLVRYSLV